MVRIEGGEFLMGSDQFYAEERPVHEVRVDGFWIDEHAVTVAEFRRFVRQTDYVTLAERPLDPADYPEADPDLLVPGALVFRRTRGPVDLNDYRNWWHYVPGASWKHPEGPASDIVGRDRHPVVHVAFEDALAYAAWAGKALPTEAEWEYAARGGLEGKVFTWGDEFAPRNRMMANTWQGEFPWQNLLLDRHEGTSPGQELPAQWLRALRHGRQRLGVDHRLLSAVARRGDDARLLRTAEQPQGLVAGPQLQRGTARRAHPASRGQGRIAPLRAELLPALSARGASATGNRHVHGASWLSLRAPIRRPPRG